MHFHPRRTQQNKKLVDIPFTAFLSFGTKRLAHFTSLILISMLSLSASSPIFRGMTAASAVAAAQRNATALKQATAFVLHLTDPSVDAWQAEVHTHAYTLTVSNELGWGNQQHPRLSAKRGAAIIRIFPFCHRCFCCGDSS
jgi:hypothetical protein